MTLQEFFAENPKVALAFSGGVDSSYLLYAATDCRAKVRAYYVKSVFQPRFELDDARRLGVGIRGGYEDAGCGCLERSTDYN